MTEGVPAQSKCFVTGTNVIRNGKTSQSSLSVSLSAGTATLVGNVCDCQNNVTNPFTGTFVWVSRNAQVATVSQSGLVTLLKRGQVDIELRTSRQANISFTNSTPSPTEASAAYAICTVQVTN